MCEDFVEFKSDCLDVDNTNILASQKTGPKTIWYYEIETRSCQQINSDCIIDYKTNTNKFDSYASCKSQCLPFVTEIQTPGMSNSF